MNTCNQRRLVLCGLALALGAATLGMAPAITHAASGKPIRLIVPFPPGGGGDRLGRLLAGPLGKALGADVVVENQGGANGNIALQNVARAETDGSVLGLTLVDHIGVNPLVYRNLPYDPLKDFKGIGLVLSTPYVMAVPEAGPRTLGDFMNQAKARPGESSIGYPTTNIQIAMLDLQSRSKSELNLIPYRGIAQGLPDMLGGRLSAWVGTSVTMRGYIEGDPEASDADEIRARVRRTHWKLDARGLQVRRGLVWKHELLVPRSRVQHLDIERGPIERRFGLATLVVHTAGTRLHALRQPGLLDADALALRDALLPEADRDDDSL